MASMLAQVPSRLSALSGASILSSSPTTSTATTITSAENQLKLRKTILERPLAKTKNADVGLASLAFLFSEIIQYTQKKVTGIPQLENIIHGIGCRVGVRCNELISWRERSMKRESKFLQMIMFIHSVVWKNLFGKQADSLEKSTDNDDEYMIIDSDPLISKFISIPKDFGQLNCNAFVAGIIEAILDGYQFRARVTAHGVPIDGHPLRTIFLIKFDRAVIEREKIGA